MSVRKNPIDYLAPEACGNLCLLCEDDSDVDDADLEYYDETNGLNIDEDWFELFCHKCGYDRETEQGRCMKCESEFINFFIEEK